MCIAVNFCGKTGPGAKSKDIEEGKAAFSKDESKEPIVEVRAEEEHTPNQGGPTEPNETTPLTEPEPAAADSTSPVVNLLPSAATNSVSESFSTVHSSPASETTTLTTSASSPTKVAPAKSSPPNSPVSPPTSLKADPQPEVGPLVDLSETPKAPPSSGPAPPASSANDQSHDSSQSQDLQVDGPTKDVPKAPSTDSTTPAPHDGKTVTDDNTKGETEVKNATAEVKTVPNEAPQTNGNESKA